MNMLKMKKIECQHLYVFFLYLGKYPIPVVEWSEGGFYA